MVPLSFNFTQHMCEYMHMPAHLPHVKFKFWQVHTLLHAILMFALVLMITYDTQDASHKLMLDLLHYMCCIEIL